MAAIERDIQAARERADVQIDELVQRLAEVERRATEAEQRAIGAERRAIEAEQRQAEQRAIESERRAGEAERLLSERADRGASQPPSTEAAAATEDAARAGAANWLRGQVEELQREADQRLASAVEEATRTTEERVRAELAGGEDAA